jgi:hypothetical protein
MDDNEREGDLRRQREGDEREIEMKKRYRRMKRKIMKGKENREERVKKDQSTIYKFLWIFL